MSIHKAQGGHLLAVFATESRRDFAFSLINTIFKGTQFDLPAQYTGTQLKLGAIALAQIFQGENFTQIKNIINSIYLCKERYGFTEANISHLEALYKMVNLNSLAVLADGFDLLDQEIEKLTQASLPLPVEG